MPDKDDESLGTDEFLATARKRFAAASGDEKDLRAKFVSDLRFASPDGDDQWDPQLKQQREMAGRPAMAFPRCHTFVQQVSNEARQNKAQIKFAPRGDADEETAEIYEGLARKIQYDSDAQIAYETAVEYSAGGSFGYFRFLTDYCDEDEKDQDLKVVPVLDPLTVYGILVPSCFHRKPRYAFVVEDIPKDEYKALYPDSEVSSIPWAEAEQRGDGWVDSESIRIAEYWYTEEVKVKGKRRPKCVVKFCKINGMEILPEENGEESSKTEWLGSAIPIVPVLGKQMIIEGKARLFSVVRPQKAAQQLINYSKSRIAETLATSPISPFMVANGQISGFEKEWGSLNTVVRPYLTYNTVDNNGQPIPPPARQVYEPPIQALSAFVMQEVDDMKATTGIFDASLGNQGNETSGQAIMRRQQQANMSTMHFMDNLERAFKQAGTMMAELIPLIYDTPREIQILSEDETPKIVQINKQHIDEQGKSRKYDMCKGKYEPIVTLGRAYGSKRQDSFATFQQLLQTSPNLLPMVGDIVFKSSDLAGADQLAERFHKMLPPNLQDDAQNPLPPQAQAAMAQAQQQTQMMQGELAKLNMERQAKVLEHQGRMQQIDLQHKADMEQSSVDHAYSMQMEDKKLETQLAVAEINTKAQSQSERQGFLEDLVKLFHSQAHELGLQAHEQAHQQDMAQQMAEQQQDQQVQAQTAPNGAAQPPAQPMQVQAPQ